MTPEQASALADAIRGGPDDENDPEYAHRPCVLSFPGDTEITIDDRFEADDLVRAVLGGIDLADALVLAEVHLGDGDVLGEIAQRLYTAIKAHPTADEVTARAFPDEECKA